MVNYLKIAEKIHVELKKQKYFMVEPAKDLDKLMKLIKIELKDENLKLLYPAIDFDNLLLKNARDSIKLDISIIPNVTNQPEFLLWLASFIEKITVSAKSRKKSDSHLPSFSKIIEPNYKLKEQSKESQCSSDAIEAYYQEKFEISRNI